MSYIGNEPRFTQFPSKFFDGDNSAMTVTLDYAPPNDAALLVFIDGVRQDTSAYNCTGTSLTFTGAVPTGTNNVQVVHMGLTLDVGVPGDDTITTVKIQDDAVTAAKLANSINTEIAANTAKVTNATHTGDVTGATALTIATDAVDIAMLSATGTASATTYLRGDNAWGAISEYNDSALLNDVATLALQQATLNNQSAYNLANAFVDQYENSTGIDVVTQCERSSGEYVSTIYTTAGNDSNTVLLLHCDGANDSTAIPDSATGGNAPHTLSMGAYIKTAQKKFGTASLYGNSASYYVDIPENADFTWGSGSFTIDMWMRAATPSGSERLWSDVASGPTYGTYARPSGEFYVNGYSSALSLAAFDAAPTADTWTHMAFEYDSGTGTARSYKDGVVQKTQTGLSGSATDVSQNPRIMRGNGDTTGQAYYGYLDEIRVSNVARYSGTGFTPVTQAYGSTATYGDGNYTSTTETSAATVSKMGIVVLYKNAYGTATLDTDLIAQVSANGGTNYTSAPLTAAGTFSTGINIAVSNDITVGNTGTAPKYKISFDNQVQSSKETQVYGVALLY